MTIGTETVFFTLDHGIAEYVDYLRGNSNYEYKKSDSYHLDNNYGRFDRMQFQQKT